MGDLKVDVVSSIPPSGLRTKVRTSCIAATLRDFVGTWHYS
jgi:hypothetical protein